MYNKLEQALFKQVWSLDGQLRKTKKDLAQTYES